MAENALVAALLEIERYVGRLGWDQPARLFALVPTADLLHAEPALAAQFPPGYEPIPGALSSIEQEEFHAGMDLVQALAHLSWPPSVDGVALAVERAFLPSNVEQTLPDDPELAAEMVAAHPERQELRVVVGVTRDGRQHGIARIKTHPEDLVGGTDLAPGLARALAFTLS